MSNQLIPCAQCLQEAIEEWRPVVGAEASYLVSDMGRVQTLSRIGRASKNKFLILQPNEKGYLRARLYCANQGTRVVHRLVLEAFVGLAPSPRHECNHVDGNKQHNHVGNLEWVTPKENAKHAKDTGLWKPHIGDAHGRALISESDILFIRSMKGVVIGRVLAERFGVCAGTIHAIWQGRNWKHV